MSLEAAIDTVTTTLKVVPVGWRSDDDKSVLTESGSSIILTITNK